MRKSYLFVVIMLSSFVMYGQSVLHYEFNNSLTDVNGNGPELTVLGTDGVFVQDTLLEIGSAEKRVYRFEANSGFQFDNTAAGNFLGEQYTIELYFVFDYLDSWKRVVDWKTRTSDNGAYVYYGELNFYPYQYSADAPVLENEYTYYVITRNADSQELIIYADAINQISFIDTGGDGLLSTDNMLNFFHDDLVVPNEASSGAVAMLKLYNYALDSATIVQKYEDLAGNVFAVNENRKETVSMNAFPNPVSDNFTLDLSGFSENEKINISVVNVIGIKVLQFEHFTGANDRISVSVSNLQSGIYFIQAESQGQLATRRIMIQ